jgi:hypothetical protein
MLNNYQLEKYQWYENNEATTAQFFQEADNRIAETERKRQEAEERERRRLAEIERKKKEKSEELFAEFRYIVFEILSHAKEDYGEIGAGSIDIADFASYEGHWSINNEGLQIFLLHKYDMSKNAQENEKTHLKDNFNHDYLNQLLAPLNISVNAPAGDMTDCISGISIKCLRKAKILRDNNPDEKTR